MQKDPKSSARKSKSTASKNSKLSHPPKLSPRKWIIAGAGRDLELTVSSRVIKLTNLEKPFWPELNINKGDLIQYYADISPVLIPHLEHRAMVMKRYPHGAAGDFFFQKRAPEPRPDWIDICSIEHDSGNIIDFPVVQDLPSLLWLINLGCIDLNPWYARCDDVNRPDYLHFDLDPVPNASFQQVLETAWTVHEALDALEVPNFPKTTGSRGIHVYVPIVRGPTQKEVWTFAKEFAFSLARLHPGLITAEYRISKRPPNHVLVDYNQNAWGRTLASVYSVRPKPEATVSMPITWDEVKKGFEMNAFTLFSSRERISKVGDLWRPLLEKEERFNLKQLTERLAHYAA